MGHQAQGLGAVGLLRGLEVEVQAHQFLELEEHLARLVLAQFQGRIDVQLRLEVLLADHARVDGPGELAAAPGQGVHLGGVDLLQGLDQLVVVGAVPGPLDVGDLLPQVEQLGGRRTQGDNQQEDGQRPEQGAWERHRPGQSCGGGPAKSSEAGPRRHPRLGWAREASCRRST
ncbi:hypothetical protein D9M71_649240 [compost metagenome]